MEVLQVFWFSFFGLKNYTWVCVCVFTDQQTTYGAGPLLSFHRFQGLNSGPQVCMAIVESAEPSHCPSILFSGLALLPLPKTMSKGFLHFLYILVSTSFVFLIVFGFVRTPLKQCYYLTLPMWKSKLLNTHTNLSLLQSVVQLQRLSLI